MEVASVLFEGVLQGPKQPRVRPRFADPRWQLLTDEEDVPNLVFLRRRQYYVTGALPPPPAPLIYPLPSAWLRFLSSIIAPGALEEEEAYQAQLLRLIQVRNAFYYEPLPPGPQPEPLKPFWMQSLVGNQAYQEEEEAFDTLLRRTARRFLTKGEGMEAAQLLPEVVVSGPRQPRVRPKFLDPAWQLLTDEEDVLNLVLARRRRWTFDPNSVQQPIPLNPRKLPQLVRWQAAEQEEAEQHQALLARLIQAKGWDSDPIYTPNNMEVAQTLVEIVLPGGWQPPYIPNLAGRTKGLHEQALEEDEQYQALAQLSLRLRRRGLDGSPPPPVSGRRTVLMFIT
jgi:hypothetical protein